MKQTNMILGALIVGGVLWASSQGRFLPPNARLTQQAKEHIIKRRDNVDNLDSVTDVQSGVDFINENFANVTPPVQNIRVKAHGTPEQQSKALNEFVGEFAEEYGGSVTRGASSEQIMAVRDAKFNQKKQTKDDLKRSGELGQFDTILSAAESFFSRLPESRGRERNDRQRQASSFIKRLKRQADDLSGAIRSSSRDRRASINDKLKGTTALLNRKILQSRLEREKNLSAEALKLENRVSERLNELFTSRF